jgi:hypothetical protein
LLFFRFRPDKKGKRGRIKRSKSRNLLERLRDYEQDTLRSTLNSYKAGLIIMITMVFLSKSSNVTPMSSLPGLAGRQSILPRLLKAQLILRSLAGTNRKDYGIRLRVLPGMINP